MNRRYVATVLVLMAWILLGPIAMAFGACGIIGVTCDAPCGAPSCVTQALRPGGPTERVSPVSASPEGHVTSRTPTAPEPPPKSASNLT
jgi:hypothetical protein